MKRTDLSQSKQVIIALLDNREMSTKELSKYLNLPVNSLYSVIAKLKNDKEIEHLSYGRYALTDAGRERAGQIISGNNKPKQEVVEPVAEVIEQLPTDPTAQIEEPMTSNEFAQAMIQKIYEDMMSILRVEE